MVNLLRYLSLLNTGVWLGIAVFMFIVAMTIFTAPEVNSLLPEKAAKGQAGQIFFQRCYLAQYICAGAALALLLLEWGIGKIAFPKWRLLLLLLIGGLVGGGGQWLAPKLESLLRQKYPEYFQRTPQTAAARPATPASAAITAATVEHAKWHRVSEGGFVAAAALLLIYFGATAWVVGNGARNKSARGRLGVLTTS